MIIDIDEYDLEGKDQWQACSYPSSGLYLINDGATYFLISVPENGTCVFSNPVPYEQVKRHIAKEAALETEKDISARIYQRIADINEQLDNMKAQQPSQVSPQVYMREKVDGDTLLKAIAIAQNPELAVKLLKSEE